MIRCDYPGCERELLTLRGRGVHRRQAHQNFHDEQQQVRQRSPRWTPDDVTMMAMEEAKILKDPENDASRAMDITLQDLFPHRSKQSIQGFRSQGK